MLCPRICESEPVHVQISLVIENGSAPALDNLSLVFDKKTTYRQFKVILFICGLFSFRTCYTTLFVNFSCVYF
mgnify:CR=1 FL=1